MKRLQSSNPSIFRLFARRPVIRRAAGIAAMLPALLVGGCMMDTEELGGEEEITTRAQPIENGEELPSLLNAGTVRVQVMGPDETVDCSGQVISRDSILTAAHCFYEAGYYKNSWYKTLNAKVIVTHQNSDGSWETLETEADTPTAYVRKEYHDYRAQGSALKAGYDIAIVQRQKKLSNVVSSDVVALPRFDNEQVNGLHAYGHGMFTDSQCDRGGCNPSDDNQLRRAVLPNLTWYTSSGNSRYRTVLSDYGPDPAPHLCKGDSGGPWKTPAASSSSTPTVSGVQFAVTSGGEGGPDCRHENIFGPMVSFHDDWLEDRVDEGLGSCTDYSYEVLKILGHYPSVATIRTKVCW